MAKTPEGYRVARVLSMTGPGPAWEQVAMVADFEEAIRLALDLAKANGRQAWIPTSAGLCEPIPANLVP